MNKMMIKMFADFLGIEPEMIMQMVNEGQNNLKELLNEFQLLRSKIDNIEKMLLDDRADKTVGCDYGDE